METPNICLRIGFKLKSVFNAFGHPYMVKFICFLILQGLTMPNFLAYDYIYAIDVLKIPLTLVNI